MPETPDDGLPEASFLNFLSGIAAQGLMQLGELPNPIDGERQVNLPHARYTIELLAVLRTKTEGNRDAEEESYLQSMISDLERRYAQLGEAEG